MFVVLLVASSGLFLWLPRRIPVLFVVVPALLGYGWVRFVVLIWKPVYKQEVSPGWSVTLLFAAFGIFFMLMALYRAACGELDL